MRPDSASGRLLATLLLPSCIVSCAANVPRAGLEPAVERVETRFEGLVATLPQAGLALVIVLGAWLLSRAVGRWDRPYRRLQGNRFVSDLVRGIARALVLLVGLAVALEILDSSHLVGALAGIAGVAGLALGFAFRDLIENYVASILLSLRQPFAPNDHVQIDRFEGRVARLTSRATILITPDGHNLRIPNATVFKGIILNFTRNPERRFGYPVSIHPSAPIAEVQALLLGALAGTAGVLAEPRPAVLVEELGAAAVQLRVLGWVNQNSVDFGAVQSEAMRGSKEALAAAGVPAPEPVYRLRSEPEAGMAAPAATVARPIGPAPKTPAPPADISPDPELERQSAEEGAAHGVPNLLDSRAPRE